jgi:hypothetical protein
MTSQESFSTKPSVSKINCNKHCVLDLFTARILDVSVLGMTQASGVDIRSVALRDTKIAHPP